MKSATAASCLSEEGCPRRSSGKSLSPASYDRRRVGNLTVRDRNLTSADVLTQFINGVALYVSVDAFHVLGAVFLSCSQHSFCGLVPARPSISALTQVGKGRRYFYGRP